MPEGLRDGPPPEMTENEGNIPESENPEENQEEEIIIEEIYDGENPRKFIMKILEDAHEKGYPLTFKEVMKQIEEASQDTKEKEFSFDNMHSKSVDIIIPKGITIVIKAKPTKEEPEKEEEKEEQEDDDDDYDEDEDEEKREDDKTKTIKTKEIDIFETESIKVRKTLNSKEGRDLDNLLEKIKRTGISLVAKLLQSENTESEGAKGDRLLLFRNLEYAQDYGDTLTKKLRDEFDITLRRELVPTDYILAYLKSVYKEQGLEIPTKISKARQSADLSDSIRQAVDERLK